MDRMPGGSPVGQLADLDRIEASIVLYFRLWSDGSDSQVVMWNDLALGLGAPHGRKALKAFAQLFDLCTRFNRRPLSYHAVNCQCVGADEACLANFITTSATGDREDALLIATLLFRPDVAPAATAFAMDIGLALKCMFLRNDKAAPPRVTLH